MSDTSGGGDFGPVFRAERDKVNDGVRRRKRVGERVGSSGFKNQNGKRMLKRANRAVFAPLAAIGCAIAPKRVGHADGVGCADGVGFKGHYDAKGTVQLDGRALVQFGEVGRRRNIPRNFGRANFGNGLREVTRRQLHDLAACRAVAQGVRGFRHGGGD